MCTKLFKSCTAVEDTSLEGSPARKGTFAESIDAGTAFFITGKIPPQGDRFAIDFCLNDKDSDIALRLAGCVSKNSLTRNTRARHKWGSEESNAETAFQLVRDTIFEILLYFQEGITSIAFEGNHLGTYAHRLPVNLIRSVEIRGDLMDISVVRKTISTYPERRRVYGRCVDNIEMFVVEDQEVGAAGGQLNIPATAFLPLPYFALFRTEKFLKFGYKLIIKGIVKTNPTHITIALQMGQDVFPGRNKAIQMDIRFNKHRHDQSNEPIIAFDSYLNFKWRGENKCLRENGLRPGAFFKFLLLRGDDAFKVYVNGNHLYNYPYYTDPASMDTCYVDGDINLIEVRHERV